MFKITHRGDWKRAEKYLKGLCEGDYISSLEKYGELGLQALKQATPKDSGVTAASWYYQIEKTKNGYSINWMNSNVNKGVNIAVIIQMGHGTGGGGYVQGRDYINPTMLPIFDQLATDCFNEVSRL